MEAQDGNDVDLGQILRLIVDIYIIKTVKRFERCLLHRYNENLSLKETAKGKSIPRFPGRNLLTD